MHFDKPKFLPYSNVNSCHAEPRYIYIYIYIYPTFLNSVDPDQLASEEANLSGSTLFAIQYVNLYQQSGSRNLIV